MVLEYHKLSKDVVKESLEVESSSSFNPTQRLKKDSPMKDSSKQGEKLSEATSSMSSRATSPRKALKVEVEKGKLDASGEFANDKAWKPVLTTEQIKDNRGMGAT
ncbi:adhesin [Mycoplasmoides genitalium]|uniref:adhesin n=1 Tax=Mycoplasmoides genitalium TaxID=2097 RepID=UPI0002D2A9DB|nr:adhesin [Mycoplasmoides genitalium]